MVAVVWTASLFEPLLSSHRVSTLPVPVQSEVALHRSDAPSAVPSASGSVASSHNRAPAPTSSAGRAVTEVVAGVPVPIEVVAATETVYVTPFVRPVRVHVVAVAVAVQVRVGCPAAVAVTVVETTGDPLDTAQETAAVGGPAAAPTPNRSRTR
mgnify:CR=1 FL=1